MREKRLIHELKERQEPIECKISIYTKSMNRSQLITHLTGDAAVLQWTI